MKYIIVILLSFSAFALNAQQDCCAEEPYFQVTATAEKRIVPDVAYLGLSIREIDQKRNPINMANAERDLLNALDKAGIDRSNLKVAGLSGIQQKINRRKIGHVQNKNYTLVLKDFSKIDDLLDELDRLQVVDIYLQKLDNTKMDDHKIEVYAAAMKMAKRKADAVLGAVGQSTDGVIYVHDQPQGYYGPAQARLRTANVYLEDAFESMPVENDVALDDIVIRQQLNVRFRVN